MISAASNINPRRIQIVWSFLFVNRTRVLSLTTSSFVQASRLFPRMTNYVTYLSHYSDALLSQSTKFWCLRGTYIVVWSTSACEKAPSFSTVYCRLLNDPIRREQPPRIVRRYNYLRKNVTKVIASVHLLRVSSRSIIVLSTFLKTAILIYLVLDFLNSRLFSFLVLRFSQFLKW